jgi:rubrerythrin
MQPFGGIDVGMLTRIGMPMSDKDQLRNRSARLVAMAVNARNEGHPDYAQCFMQRASEILSHPTALERLGTHGRNRHVVRLRLHRKARMIKVIADKTCLRCGRKMDDQISESPMSRDHPSLVVWRCPSCGATESSWVDMPRVTGRDVS